MAKTFKKLTHLVYSNGFKLLTYQPLGSGLKGRVASFLVVDEQPKYGVTRGLNPAKNTDP